MFRQGSDSNLYTKSGSRENELSYNLRRSRTTSKSCLMLGQIKIPNLPDDADVRMPLLSSKEPPSSKRSTDALNSSGKRENQKNNNPFSTAVPGRASIPRSPLIVRRSSKEGVSARRMSIVPLVKAEMCATVVAVKNIHLSRARFLGLMGLNGRQGPLPNKMQPEPTSPCRAPF